MGLVSGGKYVAQFGKVLGVRGEIQLAEEGQCDSRLQVAVDVVEARQEAAEDGGVQGRKSHGGAVRQLLSVQRTGPEHSRTRRARRSRASDRSATIRSMSLPRTSAKAVAEVAWSSNQSTHSE